jgi:hypothetical protein
VTVASVSLQVSPIDCAAMFALGVLARLIVPLDSKREAMSAGAQAVVNTVQDGGGLWALAGVRMEALLYAVEVLVRSLKMRAHVS